MLFRAIIQGDPGSGKNGLLASASALGYRIIIGSFEEDTSQVTQRYAKHPENVHVVPFRDEVMWQAEERSDKGQVIKPEGLVFKAKAAKALELFLFSGRPQGFPKNETLPYGRPKEWDDKTIFALDTLTTLGGSCELRATELNPMMPPYSNAYAAALDQERICELLVSFLKCHVVVLSHLRLISPKAESTFATQKNPETDLQKQIKRERAKLQETAYYPTMITEGIARNVVRHFPFSFLNEVDHDAQHPSKRVLRTKPIFGYQIKCPLDIPDKLPIETALATILEKLR